MPFGGASDVSGCGGNRQLQYSPRRYSHGGRRASRAAYLESLAWKHGHVLEAEQNFEMTHRFAQPSGGRDIVIRGQQWQVSMQKPIGRSIFLRASSRITASSSKRPPRWQPAPAVFSSRMAKRSDRKPLAASIERRGHVEETFFAGAPFVRPGVDDHVVGADGDGALSSSLRKATIDCARMFPGGGCEIDQVVGVHHQRRQVVLPPHGVESPDVVHQGRAGPPHSWAGREDLKGVGAEFDGL